MITISNVEHEEALKAQTGSLLVASLDVEWTKNYKIRGGNIPFCYSALYLQVPASGPVGPAEAPFTYTSVYVEHADETQQLITAAANELEIALEAADLIVGHQFTSDLATLGNASNVLFGTIEDARRSWRGRRDSADRPRIIDTRYDTGHALTTTSRRLVDVCTDLRLDVTQPELRGSMTAMHHRWLETGETELRERISVLNLRHSLSAALVALRAEGLGQWDGTLNVNQVLHAGLDGSFGWLAHPTFTALLEK